MLKDNRKLRRNADSAGSIARNLFSNSLSAVSPGAFPVGTTTTLNDLSEDDSDISLVKATSSEPVSSPPASEPPSVLIDVTESSSHLDDAPIISAVLVNEDLERQRDEAILQLMRQRDEALQNLAAAQSVNIVQTVHVILERNDQVTVPSMSSSRKPSSAAAAGMAIVVVIGIAAFLILRAIKDTSDDFQCVSDTIKLRAAVDALWMNSSNASTISSRYGPFELWCVSNVQDFSDLFSADRNVLMAFFNGNVTKWDVSSATSMNGMFKSAVQFNQDLSLWNTSQVTNMDAMFRNASSFNTPIESWDVSRVQSMNDTFHDASAFNQDLSAWDVSSVKYMLAMFYSAENFNGDLSRWNTSSLRETAYMFRGATVFNQELKNWDLANLTSAFSMFAFAVSFDKDISTWKTSRVTTMGYMFDGGC